MIVGAAVAVAAGTVLGHGRAVVAWPATGASVLLLVAVGLLRRRTSIASAVALVVLVAASAASAAWRTAAAERQLLTALARRSEVARVCGGVTERRPHSVEIAVRSVQAHDRTWRVAERLRVSRLDVMPLPGERICVSGELTPARDGRVEPPLMRADHATGQGVASPLRRMAAVVRHRFSDAARNALPRTHAGLLLGMTDGDTELIDEATMDDFRTTGLAHLVAVSGYNVAVVLALVMLLGRVVFPRGRWLRVILAVPVLVFFAFLTGLEASVLRATVSAGVALAVVAGGRTADALRAAAFAFVALVLVSPEILFAPGFQLSFGATLGIIVWGTPLSERLARAFPDSETRLARAISSGFGTTIAAQLAVAPLLAWHFGRIPGIGGFANLIAIPLGGTVMVGGMLTLSAASLVPFLGWAPATMRLLLEAILWSARAFSRIPAASLSMNVAVALTVTSGAAAAVASSRRVRAIAVAMCVVGAAIAAGGSLADEHSSCRGGEVRALDVGQGTAVLVRAGDHSVLLDGGPRDGGVVSQLAAIGVKRLDVAVVSHPHADHVEGFVDVLERMEVGRVIGPVIVGWGMGSGILAAARSAGVPVSTVAAGDVLEAGPIRLEILAPEAGPAPDAESPELVNGLSLLVRAEVGGAGVISPGDLGAAEQAKLLDADLAAPVLIAPHHGSPNLDPDFVSAVGPRITLVTVGTDNPYGHPSPKAMRVFEHYGPVMRTDTQGLITLCVNGEDMRVYTEKPRTGSRPFKRPRSFSPEVFE